MKKNRHSRDMQNHKKPMNKKVLEEEFSSELGITMPERSSKRWKSPSLKRKKKKKKTTIKKTS